MIDVTGILKYDCFLTALFVLATGACAGSIYLRYWKRSCADRYAALMRAAAADVDRSRSMEAAANLQVQELQTKYDRLRELTFDLQNRLDATMAKQKDESAPKPLAPSTPRVLATAGRAKIMTYLKTYTNQMSLTVAILDDPEPHHYGMQIVDALTTVGIRVYVITVGSFYVANDSDEALYGVRYTSSCPEPVRHSLEIAGLEPSPSHLTPNRADLYIGLNSRGP